ncbi:MAG: Rrf2 family transcriptional regulator [Gammaproteobacteria bacterium]|nr:Rrf2 family transcriptional regulator [Gammaproteobacteria bacterium]
MAHITASVEYGLHCLLWLATADTAALSSRELAALQGISPTFVAKIFPKLEKAGLVSASSGLRGGYRLAKPAARISLLEVVDAIEGRKPLFDCQEIRDRCAVFDGQAPRWATQGVCAIHAAMLKAEAAMRETLATQSLADIADTVARKAPAGFAVEVRAWCDERGAARGTQRRPRKGAAHRGKNA